MDKRKRDNLILKHYRTQAEQWGDSMFSGMPDEIVRIRELSAISFLLSVLGRKFKNRKLKILDLGCGNGYTLEFLSKKFPRHLYFGLDLSPELLAIAKNRKLPKVKFFQGDARVLDFPAGFFDFIYTERCLINILNKEEQQKTLFQIHRVLEKKGYYLMIECFTDGLENYNRARKELGLKTVKEAYHNKYFDKDYFFKSIKKKYQIIEPEQISKTQSSLLAINFLSSHYFISRVVYPSVTKKTLVYNNDFVKFFSFLPPIGNYSPLQLHLLKKI